MVKRREEGEGGGWKGRGGGEERKRRGGKRGKSGREEDRRGEEGRGKSGRRRVEEERRRGEKMEGREGRKVEGREEKRHLSKCSPVVLSSQRERYMYMLFDVNNGILYVPIQLIAVHDYSRHRHTSVTVTPPA